MQIVRLPPGNMSYIIQIIQIVQIRYLSILKGLDHELGMDDLSEVMNISSVKQC